jgi:hypothetical protein
VLPSQLLRRSLVDLNVDVAFAMNAIQASEADLQRCTGKESLEAAITASVYIAGRAIP